MRDLIAGLVAAALLVMAASLATTLHFYRRRRARTRDIEHGLGRTIVAEIPAEEDFVIFSEDERQFHYGSRSIDKDRIAAVRILINGARIAAYVSERHRQASRDEPLVPGADENRPEGIAHDRWDVTIETIGTAADRDLILVECGSIRERVSQALARAVFDAVRQAVEQRDHSNDQITK